MSSVGIIANPASGKDIRRIVAQGWVVSNQEKVAILRRVLRGLEAAGVEQVFFMPDPRGLCFEALNSLGHSHLTARMVDIPMQARQEDSTAAGRAMTEAGVGCIITLGGDGTNRAVFKGSGGQLPLLPISSGTNNVFPEFQEGTTAGYAAGLVATGQISLEKAGWRSKVLLVYRETSPDPIDLALVDLAVATDNVIGARAIWEIAHIRELFLTRAQPWSIGLSAIGGAVHYLPANGPLGLHLKFGKPGQPVQAPIGPGLFSEISISENYLLKVGEQVALEFEQAVTLAFDGERDLSVRPGERLLVRLSAEGPWVLDTQQALCSRVLAEFRPADYVEHQGVFEN